MSKTIRFTLEVEVTDPQAFIAAAQASADSEGAGVQIGTLGEASIFLLYPSASPPGCVIHNQTFDETDAEPSASLH